MAETREQRLERLATTGDWVMRFVEDEGKDGAPPRSISFVGIEIQPLGYGQLAGARLHLPMTVPLDWRGAKVLETDIEGVDVEGVARENAVLESVFSSSTVSLQRGGWLPSGLAITRPGVTIIPDRNVIAQIRARYEGESVVGPRGLDFLDLVADREISINPLLFAMEGNGRGIPSPAAVEAQLDEAMELIRKALPKASLTIGPFSLEGALGMIEDGRASLLRKQAFLLEIAPSLETPTAHRLRDAR